MATLTIDLQTPTAGRWEMVDRPDESSSPYIVARHPDGTATYLAAVEGSRQPSRKEYQAPREHAFANARLMAAAKDLLAAAEMFDRWPADMRQDGLRTAYEAIRAAVLKATGN